MSETNEAKSEVSSPAGTPRAMVDHDQLLVDAANRLREECLTLALGFDNLAKELVYPDLQQGGLRRIFELKQRMESISDESEDLCTLIRMVRRLYYSQEKPSSAS